MFEQEDEWISKTQMKKQMNGLQDLGMELTRLSNDTLKKIGLDEDLYDTVVTYKKITSNGALKRQAQFIGRLMRDTDPAPIEAFLAKLRGDDAAHNAFLQRVERARVRLLADEGALTQFMSDFPNSRRGQAEDARPQHQKRTGTGQTAEKLPRPVSRIENRDGKRGRGNLGIFSDGIRRYLDWKIKCCSVKRPPPFWRQP